LELKSDPVVQGRMEEPLPDDDDGSEGSSYDDGRRDCLGGTLSAFGLGQAIVDTHAANELGLVRSEVLRLRSKVERLEHEKEMMVDDFNITTQMLLDRIRCLENEKTGGDSRPQTAAILERVETTWGSSAPSRRKNKPTHEPEILRIEEEDPGQVDSPTKPAGSAASDAPNGDLKECGNCGQQISVSNFTMHSVYCYRNNFRCDVCDEVLPVSEKESHTEHWTDPMRLIAAAKERDLDTVQAMCSHGADFQTAVHPASEETVLHVAAANSDVPLLELCMGYGVDVDPMNAEGETPLHVAASKAEMPVVRLLVELGATLNISNGIGESPLMLVCRRGNADTARYLVEKKADTAAKNRLGDTPLEIAQRAGFQETVLALSMAGATLRPGTPQRVRQRSGSRPRSQSPKPSPPSRENSMIMPLAPVGSSGGGGYPPRPAPRRPHN